MKCVYVISALFHARQQIHFWHLETKSYAMHKALNEYYDSILDLTDDFVETYFGKYGRQSFGGIKFEFKEFSKEEVVDYLKNIRSILCKRDYLEASDTDLHNILDEILALTNKTLYLLTLE